MTDSKLSPGSLIARFVARRSLIPASLWGGLFGISVFSSAYGFVISFPTLKERAGIVASFGNNIGLKALFGKPYAIDTVGGFTQWRALAIVVLIGSVWAIMHSTQVFRGDEDNGRWEMLLSGITNQRRAAAQALLGLGAALVAMYVVVAVFTIGVGQISDVGFTLGQSLLFSVTILCGPAMFLVIGALASQIAASRRQALLISAIVFGIAFLMRAAADSVDSYEWLRTLSPLGWVEQTRALTDSQPVWFAVIAVFILVVGGLTVYLAGLRDLGSGFISESSTRKSHTRFLNGSWGLTLRLVQSSMLGWWAGTALAAAAFGSLAKTAAEALSSSSSATQIFQDIGNTKLNNLGEGFLSIIFMVVMIVLMVMAAGGLGGIREEEASSHLDNLIVRSVPRSTWLASRVTILSLGILVAGVVAGVSGWAATNVAGLSIPFDRMIWAGVNLAFPALLLLGFSVLIFGIWPRITTAVGYGIIASSFLIQFLAAAIKAPDWVLKLSVLNYSALAPSVDPDWHNNLVMLVIAVVATGLGTYLFTKRDIQAE